MAGSRLKEIRLLYIPCEEFETLGRHAAQWQRCLFQTLQVSHNTARGDVNHSSENSIPPLFLGKDGDRVICTAGLGKKKEKSLTPRDFALCTVLTIIMYIALLTIIKKKTSSGAQVHFLNHSLNNAYWQNNTV